eukprot:CAMPEP_0195249492 /NCGR_PEP_ID=MMETSP0706-20130129/2150_1 /TAXON_ID=33640 /ORGANISM="Asterionellopsis glacialis, Strain CCMP134" /LENGTH=77 /DNA_ID=CAMNT_0040301309 /DNA_START=331 /DNA_END=564 /DNA_ORIENTATION=+
MPLRVKLLLVVVMGLYRMTLLIVHTSKVTECPGKVGAIGMRTVDVPLNVKCLLVAVTGLFVPTLLKMRTSKVAQCLI